jgi:uncharacterized membrane protein
MPRRASVQHNENRSQRFTHPESTMAKTLSFGAMHVGIAFGLGYAFTGSVATAGVLTVVEPLCNMVAHHFFEGWWERRERPGSARRREGGVATGAWVAAQRAQPDHGLLTAVAAHVRRGLQRAADRRPPWIAEDRQRSCASSCTQRTPPACPGACRGWGRRSTGRCSRRRSAGGSPWRHCST